MNPTATKPRFNLGTLAPDVYKALDALDAAAGPDLDGLLKDLIRTHASMINGCAFCIDMHTKDAREAGESELRLYSLPAWRETPYYSDRERAALAFTEAVTLVHDGHVSDEAYAGVREHFTEEEVGQLLSVLVSINAWNRIAITARTTPGKYRPE
ncbi:MAG: carboxymuconolactone decarboxylase family protein [Nocardioidaceae bacterium]